MRRLLLGRFARARARARTRRPSISATRNTRIEPISAPPTPDDVIAPWRYDESSTASEKCTPEYSELSSCVSTKLVAPISYPNNNPPSAGKRKTWNTAPRLKSAWAVSTIRARVLCVSSSDESTASTMTRFCSLRILGVISGLNSAHSRAPNRSARMRRSCTGAALVFLLGHALAWSPAGPQSSILASARARSSPRFATPPESSEARARARAARARESD